MNQHHGFKKISLCCLGAAIFLALSMTGCGDDYVNKKHKQRASELEDREALRATFRPLVGTYVGEVSNEEMGKDPFPVQLVVFIGEVPDGVNEDGELRLRPELRALYRRLDYRYDSTSEKQFLGRYYVETSTLSFVTQSVAMKESEAVTFSGTYRSGEISGVLNNYRGLVGRMRVRRVAQ